jgi:hypothetical protein
MARRRTWSHSAPDPEERKRAPHSAIDWDALNARLDELAIQFPITPEERVISRRVKAQRYRARKRAERDAELRNLIQKVNGTDLLETGAQHDKEDQ